MYLTKYMTKDYQGLPGGGRLPRAVHVGKPLFYKWHVVEGQTSLPDVGGISWVVHKKIDFTFRKSVSVNLDYLKFEYTKTWKDRPVICNLKNCSEPVVIKALEFLAEPYKEILSQFGKYQGDNIFLNFDPGGTDPVAYRDPQ